MLLKTGHKAIMTPTSTNYFDYYQGSPDTEPIAIGGDLRLPKVYAYNPIPKELTPEQAKYIWETGESVDGIYSGFQTCTAYDFPENDGAF